MPIETICQGCAARLRVPDESAGRKARCPNCGTVYTVPSAVPEPRGEAASSERWRMRAEDGALYGPVTKAELDRWAAEGRVTAACQLERDGEMAWQRADRVFPWLGQSTREPHEALQPASANPYASPMTGGPWPGGPALRPHRAGVVLTLGIVGLLCCQVLASAAWIVGHLDLRDMDAGRMDPSGRSMTQAGMILGIIGTVLLALYLLLNVLVFTIAALGGMPVPR